MRSGAVLLSMLCATSVFANDTKFLSADGGVFQFQQNVHGVVLTSVDPRDQATIVAGTPTPKLRPGDVLYLGRSCDAFSEQLGQGTWRWADDGFMAEFANTRLAFPGQRLEAADASRCEIVG